MTAFLIPAFSGSDCKELIDSIDHSINNSCLPQENERLFQEWLWRKHLLEQLKKGLSKIGNSRYRKGTILPRLSTKTSNCKHGDGVVNSG